MVESNFPVSITYRACLLDGMHLLPTACLRRRRQYLSGKARSRQECGSGQYTPCLVVWNSKLFPSSVCRPASSRPRLVLSLSSIPCRLILLLLRGIEKSETRLFTTEITGNSTRNQKMTQAYPIVVHTFRRGVSTDKLLKHQTSTILPRCIINNIHKHNSFKSRYPCHM
jgi:hypothetical protein